MTDNPNRADKAIKDDPFELFTEWTSEADERAYGDLGDGPTSPPPSRQQSDAAP